MKRFVCAVLALAMLVVSGVWAEEEELHRLWGIEFGQDLETVQEILKNEHGLDMEYITDTDPGFLYKRFKDSDEMTIYGFPVQSIFWFDPSHKDIDNEKIRIEYFDYSVSPSIAVPSGAEVATQPLTDILNALVEQFGPISFATYKIYSDGDVVWKFADRDCLREVGHFEDLNVESINLRSLMDTRDYITVNSYVTINVTIDNIMIGWGRHSPSEFYIYIGFSDSIYEDTQEDMFESPSSVQYEDKGF